MPEPLWRKLVLPPEREDRVWELFHENSKTGRWSLPPPKEAVVHHMQSMHESLPYHGYPEVLLPSSCTPLSLSLHDAITQRSSPKEMQAVPLTLLQVKTLLHYAYGVSRPDCPSAIGQSFRMVPSAGALYPLELYLHTAHCADIEAGLYHYNPLRNSLRLLRTGNQTEHIANALVQPEVAQTASVIMLVTAMFGRTIFKYGNRGYRFVYLEAGHVAQNLNLVATAMGLGCLNIGGFRDSEIDGYLELDGLTQSTIYVVAIGGLDLTNREGYAQ